MKRKKENKRSADEKKIQFGLGGKDFDDTEFQDGLDKRDDALKDMDTSLKDMGTKLENL